VLHVVAARDVLKVLWRVVQFGTVDVVNFLALWTWTNECGSDHPMNELGGRLSVLP